MPDAIPNREKGFIFDRDCDQKYISVEVRISEEELEKVYAISDMFTSINRKSEWREPTKILEWALFCGLFDAIPNGFEAMNDNCDITPEQYEQFRQKWENADWDTRNDIESWGLYGL